MKQQSIYLIAGEVSGDTHGAELIHALYHEREELQIHGTGGPKMRSASGDKIRDWVEDAAVMGFWEVLKHYPWFRKQFAVMRKEIITLRPDALVLIDYPGFNLRMAKAIRAALPDTKIIYYISPQVWAWNKGRIPKMAAILDLMLCILPFEKKLFESSGLRTEFVGHPLVDELTAQKLDITRDPCLAGLFPGSREREITRHFPMMVHAARFIHDFHPEIHFQAPAVSPKIAEMMHAILKKELSPSDFITISIGDSHRIMQQASCGVITSGTATLEAAWYGLPYCLVYRTAWPTYFLGKLLVKIDYIGLVNILAGKEVVKEYIQLEADPFHIYDTFNKLATDPDYAASVKAELATIAAMLGEPGCHSRAAHAILETIPPTAMDTQEPDRKPSKKYVWLLLILPLGLAIGTITSLIQHLRKDHNEQEQKQFQTTVHINPKSIKTSMQRSFLLGKRETNSAIGKKNLKTTRRFLEGSVSTGGAGLTFHSKPLLTLGEDTIPVSYVDLPGSDKKNIIAIIIELPGEADKADAAKLGMTPALIRSLTNLRTRYTLRFILSPMEGSAASHHEQLKRHTLASDEHLVSVIVPKLVDSLTLESTGHWLLASDTQRPLNKTIIDAFSADSPLLLEITHPSLMRRPEGDITENDVKVTHLATDQLRTLLLDLANRKP